MLHQNLRQINLMEFFFFGGAIPKVKINQSEGLAEFPPHPPSAKPEHRIEPRHLLEYLRAETRRKILFSLGKKEIGRAQNEKSKEYFPAGHASEASGGGAVQSVFRSKKVRAKDIISPPIETSRFERIAPRGRVAAALRKTPRRFAAKRLGGLNSKRADLSVSYLKTI